jgi:putative addiction module component (TIGR02574 family)
MTETVTDRAEVLSAARKLAPAERLELVEQLLDSLDQPDSAIDALWASEAQNRLAAYERGEIGTVPLSTVMAKYTSR